MSFGELKTGDKLKHPDYAGIAVEVTDKTEQQVVLTVIGRMATVSYYAAEFDERFELIPAPPPVKRKV